MLNDILPILCLENENQDSCYGTFLCKISFLDGTTNFFATCFGKITKEGRLSLATNIVMYTGKEIYCAVKNLSPDLQEISRFIRLERLDDIEMSIFWKGETLH